MLVGKSRLLKSSSRIIRNCLALVCTALLVPGSTMFPAQAVGQEAASQDNVKIPPDQLDSLVAPIALYPDPMLAQVLAASTYPLEVMQLEQWLAKNKELQDKALADAVAKQPWDPSVQSLAGLPDVVKRLSDDIQWTTDLGNAFLSQESDVMDAVQRMRKKAQDKGNLKSNEQQKVETKVVENKSVIVVEQASPEVVFVPSYNPTVVYGPPPYPYPPIAYPPPGYYAAGMAISFGVGVAMGAMWSGGWGYNCGWGGNNNITINNYNNFNRNTNIQGGNRVSNRSGNSWQHNAQHRGGTPYSNRATANRYGGTTRNASLSDRQAVARQNEAFNRGQAGGLTGQGQPGQQLRSSDRGGGGGAGSVRSANRQSGGDRIGDRSVSPGGGAGSNGNRGAFGGAGGSSGSSARASSTRGSSSMGGGGGFRGGGGRRR